MSDIEIKKSEKKKISSIERIDNYNEDTNCDEKIVCFELEVFDALNNIYNLLKVLQVEGYDVDEVIEEFITFYNKNMRRRNYLRLYNMLKDIKENLCEGQVKTQLAEDISTVSCKLGALFLVIMGDM